MKQVRKAMAKRQAKLYTIKESYFIASLKASWSKLAILSMVWPSWRPRSGCAGVSWSGRVFNFIFSGFTLCAALAVTVNSNSNVSSCELWYCNSQLFGHKLWHLNQLCYLLIVDGTGCRRGVPIIHVLPYPGCSRSPDWRHCHIPFSQLEMEVAITLSRLFKWQFGGA